MSPAAQSDTPADRSFSTDVPKCPLSIERLINVHINNDDVVVAAATVMKFMVR